MYEWGSTDIGTILDDVECHGPFKKLPEYIAQEQLSYEKKIEEQTLFYQLKTGWSWLFD